MKKFSIIKEADTGFFSQIENIVGRMLLPSMNQLCDLYEVTVDELVEFTYSEFNKLEQKYGKINYEVKVFDHFHSETVDLVSLPGTEFGAKVMALTVPESCIMVNLYAMMYLTAPYAKFVQSYMRRHNNLLTKYYFPCKNRKMIFNTIKTGLKHEYRHACQFNYLAKKGKIEETLEKESKKTYYKNRLEIDAHLYQCGISLPLGLLF